MSNLIDRSVSEKQANAAQFALDRLNTDVEKLIAKLESSDFFLFEEDPRCSGSFAKYVYNRLGIDTKEIVDSLHGDRVLAQEKLTKLVASLRNMQKFLNEKASAKFILDNGGFALGEVFVQTFRVVNQKSK